MRNYQIRFEFNIYKYQKYHFKLQIKPIIRIEACNNCIIHINMFLCMMDDYGY